jgi:hypothetical protein
MGVLKVNITDKMRSLKQTRKTFTAVVCIGMLRHVLTANMQADQIETQQNMLHILHQTFYVYHQV